MNLDWYVFEESYLLDLEYQIGKCSLRLLIDAKKSIDHPEVTNIKSYEDTFEEIEISFTEVQYYKGISSLNLLKDPNDDMGSIYQVLIGVCDVEDGMFLEFDSEMISFRAGIGQYIIRKKSIEE